MLNIKDEIYFVQDSLSKKIKIGYSSNFKLRFSSLSSHNANKLFILGTIEGTEEDEQKLHKKFIKYRTHGEWFQPANEIINFIKTKIKEEDKKICCKKKEIDKDEKEECLFNITQVAKECGLSRARFYQLMDNECFEKPLYDDLSHRPYYTNKMLEKAKKVIKTNIGINGKICLFYSPRLK